jgi:Mlc titration factor MtfA (ptsG expression regulator)
MNYTPYIILLVFLMVALYLILRKKSRKVTVLTAEERNLLSTNVTFYAELSADQKKLFEARLSNFLAGVAIEGVGTNVTVLDRMLVAASAVIPIFGFKDWTYQNLGTVVLYPDTFNKDFEFADGDRNILGMVGDGYMNGQMILSQSALRHGFSNSAGNSNTGIHEFVHLIDKSDGATDGVPQHFIKHEYVMPWIKMMHQEIRRIEENKSDINPYATTNEAEFFAVVSEYFFENPERMKDKHPELYQNLSSFFGQKL